MHHKKSLNINQRILTYLNVFNLLEHLTELLKEPNDVCECIIVLLSLKISTEKKDQVISLSFKQVSTKEC